MIGPPGSGKSFLSKKIINYYNNKNWFYYNNDTLINKSKKYKNEILQKNFINNKNIIFDNTHPSE